MKKIENIKSLLLFSVSVALVASIVPQLHASAADTLPGSNVTTIRDASGNPLSSSQVDMDGISTDGNLITYQSADSNLPNSTSGDWGVYQYNVNTGVTTRSDSSTDGAFANNSTLSSAVSETGRYIAFNTEGTNLIDGTTSPAWGLYMKDQQTGTTTALELGTSPIYDNLEVLSVSNDGRFVLISTEHTNLFISGAPSGTSVWHLVMLDTQNKTATLIDAPTSGPSYLQSSNANLASTSCDGQFVTFGSTATNLVSGFSGSSEHVYLVDLRNGFKITDLTSGATAMSYGPAISCNGEQIVYSSEARNVVGTTPPTMNSSYHLVEYNRITGQSSYIDSDSSGSFSNSTSTPPVNTVSDGGDVMFNQSVYGEGEYHSILYLKHIDDGSGTLENVEKYSGSYVTYYNANQSYAYITPNGKYILYAADDASSLGLSEGDPTTYIRSETGLSD